MTTAPLVHDLVRLVPEQVAAISAQARAAGSDWVGESLTAAPWVVVRRMGAPTGVIPVGVRGGDRYERWAAYVPAEETREVRRPDQLISGAAPRPGLAPVRALALLERDLPGVLGTGTSGFGPGGSCGFEIATGRPVMRPEESDLDLVIRLRARIGAPSLRAACALIGQVSRAVGRRIDTLVEGIGGGAHLDDLAGRGPTAVRTPGGPILLDDPWTAMLRPELARGENQASDEGGSR